MKLNFKKSKSTVKPEIIDTTSSKKIVYLRKNINKVLKTNNISGEKDTWYEYLETKLTKEEYQQYLKELEIIDIEQLKADIDYIALMTGVDLEV